MQYVQKGFFGSGSSINFASLEEFETSFKRVCQRRLKKSFLLYVRNLNNYGDDPLQSNHEVSLALVLEVTMFWWWIS